MTSGCRYQGISKVNGRRVCYAPRRPLFCTSLRALKCAVKDLLKAALSGRKK